MDIKTIEELKQIVKHDESRGRIKFATKIFYILQFVKSHPESMEELGASWCNDNIHFVANSKKVGAFLELKSNSINTNFRDHGFKIISSTTTDLKKDFPNINETRHWKKRISKSNLFTSNSTISDVEKIKLIEQNIESIIKDDQNPEQILASNDIFIYFPQQTIDLLKRDSSQLYSLSQMFLPMSEDEAYFRKFFEIITNLWTTRISSTGEGYIHTALSVILNKTGSAAPDYDEEFDQAECVYEKNIEYLLPQNFENSQMSDYVTFASFAKFFMRYSDCFDLSSTIREISLTTNDNFDESSPSFKNWFHPSINKNGAISLLRKQFGESWIMIPSKTTNKFTLLFSDGQPNSIIQALYIKHDPIPSDENKRYSVSFSDGERYGKTLDDIFKKVLRLDYPKFIKEETYKADVASYVKADVIARRKPEIDNENNENSEGNVNNDNNFFLFSMSQMDSINPDFTSGTCSQTDQLLTIPQNFQSYSIFSSQFVNSDNEYGINSESDKDKDDDKQ